MRDISLIMGDLLMELGKRQKQNGAGLDPFCIASVLASDSICVSAAARRKRPAVGQVQHSRHTDLGNIRRRPAAKSFHKALVGLGHMPEDLLKAIESFVDDLRSIGHGGI